MSHPQLLNSGPQSKNLAQACVGDASGSFAYSYQFKLSGLGHAVDGGAGYIEFRARGTDFVRRGKLVFGIDLHGVTESEACG